MLGMRS